MCAADRRQPTPHPPNQPPHPKAAEDSERDALLSVRCEALQFVAPRHLEVGDGVVVEGALDQAAHELNRMNNYKVGAWWALAGCSGCVFVRGAWW